MNRFQKWLFRKIVAQEVIQGNHMRKITQMYKIIAEEARKEFTEDNKPTLDGLLIELNQHALTGIFDLPFEDRIMITIRKPIFLPNVCHELIVEIIEFRGSGLYNVVFNGNYLYEGEDNHCAFPSPRVEAILSLFRTHFKNEYKVYRDDRSGMVLR